MKIKDSNHYATRPSQQSKYDLYILIEVYAKSAFAVVNTPPHTHTHTLHAKIEKF